MNGSTIDGAIVEVSLSKPIDKSAINRMLRGTPSPTSILSNAAAIMAAVSAAGSPSLATQAPPVIAIPFSTLSTPIDQQTIAAVAANGNTTSNSISIQPSHQYQSFQTATQSLLTTVPNVQANQSQSRWTLFLLIFSLSLLLRYLNKKLIY